EDRSRPRAATAREWRITRGLTPLRTPGDGIPRDVVTTNPFPRKHVSDPIEQNGLEGLAGGPEGDVPMSFWDHFRELRGRLTRCVLAVVIGFGGSFAFADILGRYIRRPFESAWTAAKMPGEPTLQALGIQDPLMVDFRIALTAGIFFALPVIFYQLWMFISPGLY